MRSETVMIALAILGCLGSAQALFLSTFTRNGTEKIVLLRLGCQRSPLASVCSISPRNGTEWTLSRAFAGMNSIF